MSEEKRTPQEEHDSYRDGYEKDAAAWRSRLDELKAAGLDDENPLVGAAKQGLENALNHLKTYGGESQEAASKRPTRAKETR